MEDPGETEERPLADVRVIDLTQYEAGPSATQILAWLGADVLKIERPGGEPGRHLAGAKPPGEGISRRDAAFFLLFNQSKRSRVLDLREPEGRARLDALLSEADVLAENFAPGTAESLGLGSERLRRDFPRLIVARIRGYARGGPWERFKSLDFVAQATGGAMSVTGEPDGPPTRMGVTVADSGAGLHLCIGILAALHRRQRTGRGGQVEVALQDVIVSLMRTAMIPTLRTGEPAPRTGSDFPGTAPSGLHPCAPGGPNDWVYLLLASNRHWEGVLRAIGREDLVGDARYARQSSRNAGEAEVRALVSRWTRERDKFEAMERLSAEGVPCGAVLDARELLANPQLRDSGMIVELEHPGWGRLALPGCPIRLDGPPPRIEPAPPLDEA
ncbi:MAG: CaiB/BaiF CoA transferase family protein [Myxococcota bacterium]